MNIDFKTVMSNKLDNDLLEIGANYKKYTKDALIAYLNEIQTRKIEIQNTIEIENQIKELEIKNENVGKVVKKIELHPNIERAVKIILLGIPISIIQLIISAFYMHQSVERALFNQILSLVSLSIILVWILIMLLAAWLKSGTSLSRIIIGILTGLTVTNNISSFIDIYNEGILSLIVSVINVLIACYVLYLLFNKETSNWYNSNPAR